MFAVALAAFQAAPQPSPPPGRIFAETGYLGEGNEEAGGWIRLAQSRMRFRLPASDSQRTTLVRLLAAAAERGVAFRIRYDVTTGRPDPAGDYVEYSLCSLSVGNGASFGDEALNCPERPAPSLGPGEAALVRGMAEATDAPAAARRSLAAALAAPGLNPRLRPMALEARGLAAETLANDLPWASEAYDRITFEGLADYRAWAAAAPDDAEPLHSTARLLADLGGYEEALGVYRAIGRRWPGEAFDVAVRTGALFRRQARYAEALAALDAHGPVEGMRYRYHRAWTLHLLGRAAEALAEINQGFESQPDYPYAYFIRSCAQAKLGHLQEALADQERGLELLAGFAREGASFDEIVQTGRAHVEALRRLVAAGRRQPTDLPCQGYWQRDIRARTRSPLLGPPAR
ncbi:MAG TPA: tetratricopeptide repeat protein [Allosphingosinicella sp.]|nr:tetratricopeptide repeat protein [Allosphingosinicella sp.]